MVILNSYYLFDGGGELGRQCEALADRLGLVRFSAPGLAALAIAPLLTRKLPAAVWSAPAIGTLIFHPSALPYRRGPDAIRQAVAAGERVSAATWFWCDDGWDTGAMCEQETVVLQRGERPRVAFERRFIPAALRALERALDGVLAGQPRRVPQDPALATYDSWHRSG